MHLTRSSVERVISDGSASWSDDGHAGAPARIVLCAEGPVEPQVAISRYLSEHPPTEDDPVHLVFGMRRSVPILPMQPGGCFTVGGFVPGRGLKHVSPFTYHRMSYSEICVALAAGRFIPDALIASSTAADARGRRSLGGVNGYLDLAVAVSRSIFLEEVPWMPHVPGAAWVDDAATVVLSAANRSDSQPHFSAPFDSIDVAIARHILPLLPPSPTLALGIGRVSDALGYELRGRGDIDIVSGVVTDSIMAMSLSGLTGEAPARAMSVVGSPALLEWAAMSHRVEILPSTMIHDSKWLASHHRFVAVLGAIDVDLRGNVNSETLDRRLVSGVGGAPDFAQGAHASSGGLSIVALRSHDREHRTRLVPSIADPTIPGSAVDAVVTEKGSALLRGLDNDSRQKLLERIF
jgi:acyl-CoA hydrolase